MRVHFYLILAAAALMVCCVNVPEEATSSTDITVESLPSSTMPGYVNLAPADFSKLVDDPATFVVDVHIPEQRHIKGTDSSIPYNTVMENQDKLPVDKNTVIAVYCRTGPMGEAAAADLILLEYAHIYNLAGGTVAWQKAGYELE